jgi:hypothetical protein
MTVEIKVQEKGSELCQAVTDELNHMSLEQDFIDGYVAKLKQTHPTLQQLHMRLLANCVLAMAEKADKGWMDGRNEVACKVAQRMRSLLDSEGLIYNGKPFFPFL